MRVGRVVDRSERIFGNDKHKGGPNMTRATALRSKLNIRTKTGSGFTSVSVQVPWYMHRTRKIGTERWVW
jgi:hypothetical protein